MSGRSIIEKYQWLINILIRISAIIPKFIFELMWNLTDSSERILPLLIRFLYVNKYAESCGNNIFIGKYVTLKNITNLKLYDNISIHAYCYIDSYGGIEVGNNVSIANHTSLISFEHTYNEQDKPIKYNKVIPKSIKIEDDVWIGSGVRVLSGSVIRERSIIAAGAVVNKDTPASTIVGGIPSRVLKEI